MKNTLRQVALLIFTLLSVLPATAQQAASDQSTTSLKNAETDEPLVDGDDVETIEITGRRPVSYYERVLYNSLIDFYYAYNTVASDRDFIVRCKRQKAKDMYGMTSIRVGRRSCQSMFAIKIINKYRRLNFNEFGNPFIVSKKRVLKELRARQQEQFADMMEKIEAVPALKAKYDLLQKAKQQHSERVALENE